MGASAFIAIEQILEQDFTSENRWLYSLLSILFCNHYVDVVLHCPNIKVSSLKP